MKSLFKIASILLLAFLISCGGNDAKKEDNKIKIGSKPETTQKKEPEKTETTKSVTDMDNKGIGPISSVNLGDAVDTKLASRGEEVFGNLCTACHKMGKKFVGPDLSGVTERRSPEWIMNMIMNPEEMIKKDPIAKKLLVENNMAVMANQNVSKEDTRAILEYFRQHDSQ
ncbi:c-type cytochrome [Flavobacteriaceae bacterium 14752]|uniref:c-type cytochrome n=1 Tax=Mesohalobacter salilacus TaxID=2491711 RepID=UPI000F6379C9|nr:cytochrome c [Flavobacteriaceae bacterium 14752]